MSTAKRKHCTLSIQDKHTVIERLDRGESHNKLAEEYGVGRATIYDINKNRAKIQAFVSTHDIGPNKRQTLKRADNPEVEEALYTWFLQERTNQTPISGPLLASKAKYFHKKITKKDDFVASKGWLDRFKCRHGIRLMPINGGKMYLEKMGMEKHINNSTSVMNDDNSNELHDFTTEEVIIKKEDNFSDNEYADNPSYSGEMAEDPMMMHHSAIRHEELPLEICNIKCEPEFGDDLDVSLPKSDTKKRKLDKPEESTEDEFECFGSNVAAQLRSLPLHIALQTQLKLMAVLVEARLTAQQGQ